MQGTLRCHLNIDPKCLAETSLRFVKIFRRPQRIAFLTVLEKYFYPINAA